MSSPRLISVEPRVALTWIGARRRWPAIQSGRGAAASEVRPAMTRSTNGGQATSVSRPPRSFPSRQVGHGVDLAGYAPGQFQLAQQPSPASAQCLQGLSFRRFPVQGGKEAGQEMLNPNGLASFFSCLDPGVV